MKKSLFNFILFLNLIFIQNNFAQFIGIIKDQNGEILPFVTIFIKNSSTGTFSNEEGKFSLKLNKGVNTVVFRYIGYNTLEEKIDYSGKKVEKTIIMSSLDLQLNEVVIKANAEDPAYPVIRNAIANKKKFKDKPVNYESRLYSKFKLEALDAPDKMFGVKIKSELVKDNLLDTSENVILVMETISEYARGIEDQKHETVISSRISGDKEGYNYLTSMITDFPFYNNFIRFGRNLVSPLADNTFMFYKFRLEGKYLDENNDFIYKIKIIPKVKADAVFSGYIYITHGVWNINSIDVTLSSINTSLPILDTIKIKQNYRKLENSQDYAMVNQYSNFKLNLFGFKLIGYNVRNYTDITTNKTFPPGFFNDIAIKIEKEANKRDSTYWNEIRPIPLSLKERRGYFMMDSMEVSESSKTYLDSIDRQSNKLKLKQMFLSYHHHNTYKKTSWSVTSPLINIGYNLVQGFKTGSSFDYLKSFHDNTSYSISGNVTYGFADKKLLYNLKFNEILNYKNHLSYDISCGRKYSQPDGIQNVSPLYNVFEILFYGKNYIDLYGKDFASITINKNFKKGITSDLSFDYNKRIALKNNSSYSFKKNVSFSPNIYEVNELIQYPQSAMIHLGISIKPGMKYIEMPNEMIELGTDKPTFYLVYNKALNLGKNFNSFDYAKIGIIDNFDIGAFGKSGLILEGGQFFSSKKVDVIDDNYFYGNEFFVLLTSEQKNTFALLPFYTRSEFKPYTRLMLNHDLNGLILSKIPIINKVKLKEIFNCNMLFREGKSPYFEFGAGIATQWFTNLQYFWSFEGSKLKDKGVVLSLKVNLKRSASGGNSISIQI